jgi:hypothetical protein
LIFFNFSFLFNLLHWNGRYRIEKLLFLSFRIAKFTLNHQYSKSKFPLARRPNGISRISDEYWRPSITMNELIMSDLVEIHPYSVSLAL